MRCETDIDIACVLESSLDISCSGSGTGAKAS